MVLAACTISCSACTNGCRKTLFCHERLFELILLAQTLDNFIQVKVKALVAILKVVAVENF